MLLDNTSFPRFILAVGDYDSGTGELEISVSGISGGTFHLRVSNDGENFAPVDGVADLTEDTVLGVPVDPDQMDTCLFQVWSGPANP